ncbi:MAG: tetratricopeptide repeat protein [Vicinamibacterales bacterium]
MAVTASVLLCWLGLLWRRTGVRAFRVEVALLPQHYLQALAHTSILVYWGFYWQPVKDATLLIAAQIVFAYAFGMLLAWTRGKSYTLGFGPFPIVYSINLFLRFVDDWFYLQFVMVAVGLLAKEFVRWERDGRRTHIFNPAAFTLALFSLGLILTGTTDITWGEDIASLLIAPPGIYLFILLVSLPSQFLFGVTSMTLPAVLTTYLFSFAYLQVTGTYYFFDADIPIAVFLGMHLLFTDPSTAPGNERGRILFGVIYGASVVGLYWLLGALGVPTFYDKLLQVPLMNLMVRQLDAVTGRWPTAAPEPVRPAPRGRRLAYVTVWALVFTGLSSTRALGDHHPGYTVPFWRNACTAGRHNACERLAVLQSQACRAGSGWGCTELGILEATGLVTAAPAEDLFERACSLGSRSGCLNRQVLAEGRRDFHHDDPQVPDYRFLLQEGRGPLLTQVPGVLFTIACDQGWVEGCGSLAGSYLEGNDFPQDKPRAARLLDDACRAGHARSCFNLGVMRWLGDGVAQDREKALALRKKACGLGYAPACKAPDESGSS